MGENKPPAHKSSPPRTTPYSDNDPRMSTYIKLFDFQYDLPVDHSFVLENLIDPAHVPISHEHSFGKRADATPLIMEVTDGRNATGGLSSFGFAGRYRRIMGKNDGPDRKHLEHDNGNKGIMNSLVVKFARMAPIFGAKNDKDNTVANGSHQWKADTRHAESLKWDEYEFEAPCTLRMRTHEGKDLYGHLTFHVVPLKLGQCRLLFR